MLSPRATSLLTVGLLGLVTAAGAALRLHDVEHSLWLDELHTAWCVAGDSAEIAPRARIGNYSPAYMYLAWASTQAVGLGEWGLRLPSLLAGIALIPVMHLAATRFTGSRAAGLTAAAIVALDGGFFGWYSQEARPFALVQLLAVVHVWVFFELVSVDRRPAARSALRGLLVAATVALFYLHYTTALLLCGELAWYAVRWALPGRGRPIHYAPRTLAVDLTLAVAACLPAAGHLAEIFERRANWAQFVPQPTWPKLITLFEKAPWALAISLVPWAVAPLLQMIFRRPGRIVSPFVDLLQPAAALLAYCWYLAPLSVAALLTHTGLAPVCHPRYLMASSVALPVAAACGIGLACRQHWGWGLLLAVLAIYVMPTRPSGWSDDADAPAAAVEPGFTGHFAEDWRGAVEFVHQHDREGPQAVFLWAGLIEAPNIERPTSNIEHRTKSNSSEGADDQEALRQYLLFPISGPYALEGGGARVPLTLRDDHWLPPGAAAQVRAGGGGWFIFRSPESIYPDHPKPVERLARDLREGFAERGLRCRVTQRQSFRGLAVIHLSAGQ